MGDVRFDNAILVQEQAWDELRAKLAESEAENDQWQKKLADVWAEVERLRADIETWGQMWNDATLLESRVEALRDGTADLGSSKPR